MLFTTKPCTVCGLQSQLEVADNDFQAFTEGKLVQDVFPEWSPAERELFITGTHPDCWDILFPPDEDEE